MEHAIQRDSADPCSLPDAVSRIHDLGNPIRFLHNTELRDAQLLGFAFKSTVYESVDRLLRQDPHAAVISMHMADGWSGDIRQTVTQRADQALVARRGKYRHEYLLVRSIVKKRVNDDMVGYAMCFEPRGLSKGRTGWEVLRGIIDVAPLLRCEGAKGIVIQSFCFDGALYSCLKRRLLGRAGLFYSQGSDFGVQQEEYWAKDWTVVLRCASHAGSLAVQWGLKVKSINVDDCADEIHIGMSCLQCAKCLTGQSRCFHCAASAVPRWP